MEEKQETANPKVEEGEGVESQGQPKIDHMQNIIVTLSDGRRGAFVGPMLVGMAELTLKPPLISEVVICEPRPIQMPVEREPESGKK